MNKKPVSYLQTDTRWKNVRLNCTGGTMSIGGGGCGPTSAAMLVETLTGKTCLPTETFKWACENGYVYADQGTDYGFFKPLFKKYGIDCDKLTDTVCRDKNSPVRQQVINKLKEGYYFIALMRPKVIDEKNPANNVAGTWTKGGHYIVAWWADDKIRINDPASTADKRINGDPDTFFAEAKYFWWVDARKYNENGKVVADSASGTSGASTTRVSTALIKAPVLKQGANHAGVKALQAFLNAYGIDCGTADGIFGPKTDAALRLYQKKVGLVADGICGAKTWSKILGC